MNVSREILKTNTQKFDRFHLFMLSCACCLTPGAQVQVPMHCIEQCHALHWTMSLDSILLYVCVFYKHNFWIHVWLGVNSATFFFIFESVGASVWLLNLRTWHESTSLKMFATIYSNAETLRFLFSPINWGVFFFIIDRILQPCSLLLSTCWLSVEAVFSLWISECNFAD